MSNYQEPISMVTIPLIEYENLKACEKALGAKYSIFLDHSYHRHETKVLTKDEAISFLAEQVKSWQKSIINHSDKIIDLTNKINKK